MYILEEYGMAQDNKSKTQDHKSQVVNALKKVEQKLEKLKQINWLKISFTRRASDVRRNIVFFLGQVVTIIKFFEEDKFELSKFGSYSQ
jgi:hypothetical protein